MPVLVSAVSASAPETWAQQGQQCNNGEGDRESIRERIRDRNEWVRFQVWGCKVMCMEHLPVTQARKSKTAARNACVSRYNMQCVPMLVTVMAARAQKAWPKPPTTETGQAQERVRERVRDSRAVCRHTQTVIARGECCAGASGRPGLPWWTFRKG